jgi:hypothetical protein
MNERIIQLSEQAGLKVESWMTNPPKPFQILGSTEQFEKFAELIIKQCAKISSQAEKQCQHPGTAILKHFGVKE